MNLYTECCMGIREVVHGLDADLCSLACGREESTTPGQRTSVTAGYHCLLPSLYPLYPCIDQLEWEDEQLGEFVAGPGDRTQGHAFVAKRVIHIWKMNNYCK